MAGQRPKDRYDAGFKIGSTADASRPISGSDLIIIDDATETSATESVRVGTVADMIKDYSGGTPKTQVINIFDADGNRQTLAFANGILINYTADYGDGSVSNPFIVNTALRLKAVSQSPTAYYKQTADIALTDYQLGEGWTPIGTYAIPFSGNYDGQGYKITDLVCAPTSAVAGLFGYIFGGTVTNLEIESADITGSGNYSGILSASIDEGTISLVNVSGTVASNYDAGGLCGAFGQGTMSKCLSTGSVVITNGYAGGLIGQHYGAGIVEDCYSTATVNGATTHNGGLIGYLGDIPTITNCYSVGAVANGTTVNGGLIGEDANSAAVITSCYWDITTSGQATSAGGIGKTTANMKKQATFVDWDFTDTWAITEDTSYPTLQDNPE